MTKKNSFQGIDEINQSTSVVNTEKDLDLKTDQDTPIESDALMKEETSNESSSKKENNPCRYKKTLQVASIIILTFGFVYGILQFYTWRQSQRFEQSITLALTTMLEGVDIAENCSYKINDVWYNSTNKIQDSETDEFTGYTTVKRYSLTSEEEETQAVCFDASTSVNQLYSNQEFSKALQDLSQSQEKVDLLLASLPAVTSESHSINKLLKDMFHSYSALVDLVISPEKEISSFTQSFDYHKTNFFKSFNELEAEVEILKATNK